MNNLPTSSGEEIPFNRPFIVGKELYYIAQAVQHSNLAGDGPFTRKCTSWMREHFGARQVLLTHSCTAALEIAAILCDLVPGDEIIVPSYTFVSTVNAFVLRGATPVFVDIREDTLNIDESLIGDAVTSRTRGILPVHYAGVACEMESIMEIAARHDLLVVEDAAQGVNAAYRNRFLGTIGHLGCYSFHETKNFISGEGGALVVNDERFAERAEVVRDKGTNRSRFLRGEIDKYTWEDIGSSYLASELVAAFLYAQLEEADAITNKRRNIYNRYFERLKPLADSGVIRLPIVPDGCEHNAHMFYMLLEDTYTRDKMIRHLRERNIHAVFHYVPLHDSPMGRKVGRVAAHLPVTEDLASRLLRLPCYFDLSHDDIDRVVETVMAFFE